MKKTFKQDNLYFRKIFSDILITDKLQQRLTFTIHRGIGLIASKVQENAFTSITNINTFSKH